MDHDRMTKYQKNSITLKGAVGMGTGVMIGAGIFALAGQVAELAGAYFPLIFIVGGLVTAASAYSYIRLSNNYPSAGGIGMFLVKEYGKGTTASFAALLMALSMVINQSLVARTFGSYVLQLFPVDVANVDYLVPILGVGLLLIAFLVNITGNKFIQTFTSSASIVKVMGLLIFALGGLLLTGFAFAPVQSDASVVQPSLINIIASVAFTVLAFKGFTTITNSGSEIVEPNKNVGRAIVLSILICLAVYLLVTWSVSNNLSLSEIIRTKDYALAEAARPLLGDFGLIFTVVIAIIATLTGIIASVFAVSRMLAMLTEMKMIPHSHFGMPGTIQKHTLVYTVVVAMILTIFFDLSRIASMGAIFYLIMDIMIHFGLIRNLRHDIKIKRWIVFLALFFDAVVLSSFLWIKISSDLFLVIFTVVIMFLTFLMERFFLSKKREQSMDHM